MEYKCSCGVELEAFRQDEADMFGGGSIPCYSEFDRFWETPDQIGKWDEPDDKAYIAEQEAEFSAGGLYAAHIQDALDAGINQKPSEHDVLTSDGLIYRSGTHKVVSSA